MPVAQRLGLLPVVWTADAFHDEFPDARLLALTDTSLPERQGPIQAEPLDAFLRRVVPGQPLA